MSLKKKEERPTFDPKRAFSWSAIASFEWNKDQWYKKYVLKEIPEITPELEFGSMVDKRLQDDPTYLPHVTRYPVLQHEMRCEFNGIPLIGIADTYAPPDTDVDRKKTPWPALRDYKTGRKPWNKKRADETGQLSMYCLMLWQIDKIRPEDVDLYIDWLPTHIKDGKVAFVEEDHTKLKPEVFRTKRTMHEVLVFGQRIIDTYAEMLEYCKHRPVLDTHSYDDFYA